MTGYVPQTVNLEVRVLRMHVRADTMRHPLIFEYIVVCTFLDFQDNSIKNDHIHCIIRPPIILKYKTQL